MNESHGSGFAEREKSFERKFQQDQELAFKVRARRNKLFGLWAAERMALTGTAAERYADGLVAAGLAQGGEEALIAVVARDLAGAGVEIDATRLGLELEHCAAAARRHHGAPS